MGTNSPPTVTDLQALIEAIRADLGSRMEFPRVAVFQPSTGVWVLNTDEGSPLPDVDEFDFSAPWIAAVDGDVFTVESPAVSGLIVELASRLQDIAIDATGRAWPELYRSGKFVGLAQPIALHDGEFGWLVPGLPLLTFGALAHAEPLVVA
jgi:hypothetical protein